MCSPLVVCKYECCLCHPLAFRIVSKSSALCAVGGCKKQCQHLFHIPTKFCVVFRQCIDLCKHLLKPTPQALVLCAVVNGRRGGKQAHIVGSFQETWLGYVFHHCSHNSCVLFHYVETSTPQALVSYQLPLNRRKLPFTLCPARL